MPIPRCIFKFAGLWWNIYYSAHTGTTMMDSNDFSASVYRTAEVNYKSRVRKKKKKKANWLMAQWMRQSEEAISAIPGGKHAQDCLACLGVFWTVKNLSFNQRCVCWRPLQATKGRHEREWESQLWWFRLASWWGWGGTTNYIEH